VLGKQLGEGDDYAESWEVVDHGSDQSIVIAGGLQGASLHELIQAHARDLLGARIAQAISRPGRPANLQNRFPLLFKFLDAQRDLSVQVHPNDQQASGLQPADLGKTEAWLVMAAAPLSKIYAGLRAGVDRKQFAQAIAAHRVEETLHSFEPQVGDALFIPAGTVHALGAGLLVAEIQQSSDTTFRIYDWNRVDADGNRRPLHIEAAMKVIDFTRGPVQPIRISRNNTRNNTQAQDRVTEIVRCDQFILEQIDLSRSLSIDLRGSFCLLAVIQGQASIEGDPTQLPLLLGETILVPAVLERFRITTDEPTRLLLIRGV
jgi:mannose-6-phosphate isomerase